MSLPHQTVPPFPRLFAADSETRAFPRWPGWAKIPLGWRLFGLVVLCLIPRAWEACLIRSVCHDGYYYLSVAASCESGNWANAFSYLNLNIYPLILLSLHSVGLNWLFAGKLWSVLMASLAVLPLFGWVRRLFSDQVAWAACFLYSLHAEFIEFSLEPVRDPTFWFLFNLCLYATVRAVSDGKLRWFLAGGLSLALAIHTRSEGWLLTIPFGMWIARQLIVRTENRKRLAAGGLMWLAVTPLLILLVNLTVLKDQAEWKLGRLGHFVVGYHWLAENLPLGEAGGSQPTGQVVTDSEPRSEAAPVYAPPVKPKPVSAKVYFQAMASSLEQINLALLVFGLCWLRRDLRNWDHLALFLTAFAIAGAVWILYDQTGHLDGRYFFPVYFALMPYFGTGLLLVWNALWTGARQWDKPWLKPQYTAVFLAVFAVGLGWADALTTVHGNREHEASLGDWLAEHHGPFRRVVTDLKGTRAGYHAHETVPSRLHHWGSMEWQFEGRPYDLLVLSRETTPPESRPLVEAAAERLGLVPIPLPEDYQSHDGFLVFVRPAALPSPQPLANKPREENPEATKPGAPETVEPLLPDSKDSLPVQTVEVADTFEE